MAKSRPEKVKHHTPPFLRAFKPLPNYDLVVVGAGKGDEWVARAQAEPHTNILCIDPMLNPELVQMARNLPNLHMLPARANQVVHRLNDGSVKRFVLEHFAHETAEGPSADIQLLKSLPGKLRPEGKVEMVYRRLNEPYAKAIFEHSGYHVSDPEKLEALGVPLSKQSQLFIEQRRELDRMNADAAANRGIDLGGGLRLGSPIRVFGELREDPELFERVRRNPDLYTPYRFIARPRR